MFFWRNRAFYVPAGPCFMFIVTLYFSLFLNNEWIYIPEHLTYMCMELCVCVCACLRQFLFKLSASFPSHLGPAGSRCDATSSRPFLHLQVTLGFPILAPKHPWESSHCGLAQQLKNGKIQISPGSLHAVESSSSKHACLGRSHQSTSQDHLVPTPWPVFPLHFLFSPVKTKQKWKFIASFLEKRG